MRLAMIKQSTCLLVFGLLAMSACIADNPDFDPTAGRKRIFVTASTYVGGAPSQSARPGQKICEDAVAAAGLGGRWIPWLAYHAVYAVSATEEIQDVGPWHDLRGTVIFADKEALTRAPTASLRVTELLTELDDAERVWTGAKADGTRGDNLCFNPLPYRVWYSDSADSRGDVGAVGSLDASWTQAGALSCSDTAHLICLEQ